jgi:antitoxin (DNA-binding transcriptional repressor) of toxin-antitoxin stability system
MLQTRYGISEARKNFTEVLERANRGEEIVIMRGNEVYARIGPGMPGDKRPFGLLRQRGLPDDLFDDKDLRQGAIDAGDWNNDVGVFRGKSAGNGTTYELLHQLIRSDLLNAESDLGDCHSGERQFRIEPNEPGHDAFARILSQGL